MVKLFGGPESEHFCKYHLLTLIILIPFLCYSGPTHLIFLSHNSNSRAVSDGSCKILGDLQYCIWYDELTKGLSSGRRTSLSGRVVAIRPEQLHTATRQPLKFKPPEINVFKNIFVVRVIQRFCKNKICLTKHFEHFRIDLIQISDQEWKSTKF